MHFPAVQLPEQQSLESVHVALASRQARHFLPKQVRAGQQSALVLQDWSSAWQAAH
jgi:hypothetical protein